MYLLLYLATFVTCSLASASSFTVFIDGEAGTTGLQVRDRLSTRTDLTLLTPPDELRKDDKTRRAFLNKADACILCLPDAASKQAVDWLAEDKNEKTIIIDASTAFRTDPTFTYGLPELNKDQKACIARSKRISNPGCYPTGFISLVSPLVTAQLLAKDSLLTVNAVSGYSGGGKPLMKLYEGKEGDCEPVRATARARRRRSARSRCEEIVQETKGSALRRA